MDQKTGKIIAGSVGVVLIICAFFVGKAYGAKHPALSLRNGANGFAMNGAGGRFGGTGMNGSMRGAFGGATIGTVLSKDATSITVLTPGGGSKIILYSPSTTVAKSASGSISDVTVGSTITAIGSTNSDGSVTATSIQILPQLPVGNASPTTQ